MSLFFAYNKTWVLTQCDLFYHDNIFQYVKVIVKVMTECWSGTPAARLTSLRVKKTLSKLTEILEANEKLDKLQSIQP